MAIPREQIVDIESSDPWAHRSQGMRCRTCIWWVQKPSGDGRCRRHAPTMGGFPVTMESDWCGDHRVNGAIG